MCKRAIITAHMISIFVQVQENDTCYINNMFACGYNAINMSSIDRKNVACVTNMCSNDRNSGTHDTKNRVSVATVNVV